MNLSEEELKRYDRHLILPGFGEEAQLKLKKSAVLVVGAGGLGCPCLQYLAAAGIGHLAVADGDIVSLSNLQRQILYNQADIGKFKAETAKVHLEAKNSEIKITAFNTKITSDNAQEIIRDFDLVIDGSDNFATRYLLNDVCVALNKPLVYGALFQFEGQVSTFNYKNGPTYRCLFPDPPRQSDFAGCGEVGVLGVLPGIIGTYQAAEAIKFLTGIGEVLSGKLLIFSLLTNDSRIVRFKAKSDHREPMPEVRNTTSSSSNSITPRNLDERLQSGYLQIIDVREEYEFERFNIGGINIPGSLLEENLYLVETRTPVIVVCQTGSRSGKAVEKLMQYFPDGEFYNLEGGLENYLK